jgi:hypothetical protein
MLRASPGENHAKYQQSSKRVVAIYEFFMLNIFLIWAKVRISLKFRPAQRLLLVTTHLHIQLIHKEFARNTSPFW